MSSEDSDNDDPVPSSGPEPRKVRKLVWEKSKLRNLKAKLDEAYLEGLSEKQRRTYKCTFEQSRRAICTALSHQWLLLGNS